MQYLSDGNPARAIASLLAGGYASRDAEAQWTYAKALIAWGRLKEADLVFQRALQMHPASPALSIDAAWNAYMLGDLARAERALIAVVVLDPDSCEAEIALGSILQQLDRHEEAILRFSRVLERSSAFPEARTNLGVSLLELARPDEAEIHLREAVRDSSSRDQRAVLHLGRALYGVGKFEAAIDAFVTARNLAATTPDGEAAATWECRALLELDRVAEAVALCEALLPGAPDPGLHGIYGLALLRCGEYRKGWEQYEFRWFVEPMLSVRPKYPLPVWAGQSLDGATILLRSEQGFGDVFQFVRYASCFKQFGAKVLLQVHGGMDQIAAGFRDVDKAFATGEAFTAFDYWIHLMSIPRLLTRSVAEIPASIPYIRSEPARRSVWAARLAGRPGCRVGLAWAGNSSHARDRNRSIPVAALAPLWGIDSIQYVSLQKVVSANDVPDMPSGEVLLNVGPELLDFADTAALIDELDLVICVDTAIAHLAGAMGKPVWLLLAKSGDFRWFDEGERSPWYPTAQLFRQHSKDDWSPVILDVARSLQASAALREFGSVEALKGCAAPVESSDPVLDVDTIARVVETRHGIVQYMPGKGAMSRSVAWFGEYLQDQIELLAHLVPRGAWILEAGSGIGLHALALARLIGEDGHLLAYESDGINGRLLRHNLAANKLLQHVTLPRGALGARTESQESEGRKIARHSIDDLWIERLDCIKVGPGESVGEIVASAENTLWRLRPVLLAEVSIGTTIVAQMQSFGYRCWAVETPYFSAANYNHRDRDIFEGAQAFAIVALPEERDVPAVLNGFRELSGSEAWPQPAALL